MVFFWVDGYVVWVNLKVIELVGIFVVIDLFVGGEIIKLILGELLGVFIDKVEMFIIKYVLKVSYVSINIVLDNVGEYLLSLGIILIYDVGIDYDIW